MKSTMCLALATAALSLSALCSAAGTPEGTLKEFLNASMKKDKKTIRNSIDWDGLVKNMGGDEGDPAKRKAFMERMQIIYVEAFAGMGSQLKGFKVGPVATKGNDAHGAFLRTDPATKKMVPATQFALHKKGKQWLIYNITSAARH